MSEKQMICDGAEGCRDKFCFHKKKHNKNISCVHYCIGSSGRGHFQCKPTQKPMNRNGANN